MALYAAYGPNLHPDLMSRRCPHSPLRGTGWLTGWRLTFGGEDHGWDGAMATVVESAPDDDPSDVFPSDVFVALYDVNDADRTTLDEWEGVGLGLFTTIHVRVQTLDGEQSAWLYILDAYEGGLPSAHYLGVLAEAAEAAGAPDDYVAALRARPCRSIG